MKTRVPEKSAKQRPEPDTSGTMKEAFLRILAPLKALTSNKTFLIALLVLLGFGILNAAELTGNQASSFMLPQVNTIYSQKVTNYAASISTWAVAGMLLLMSIGFGSRMNGLWSVAGFGVMAAGYTTLAVLVPSSAYALVILAVVGASSVVIAFVRSAVEHVETGLPISPNQIVGGFSQVLSQAAPFAVAWSGQTFGARPTWVWVAVMLASACTLGVFLFKRYGQGPNTGTDENAEAKAPTKSKTRGLKAAVERLKATAKSAWTPWSARATLVNFLSAVAVGSVLMPLTADIHRRGLNQAQWVLYWGIGSMVTGFFMMFVWSRIASGLRDRGLYISALITLAGGVFVLVKHYQMSGLPMLAGGLVVSLGANTFENSVYAHLHAEEPNLKRRNAQALAMNFGRALGFGLGGYFALRLVGGAQYTWMTLGSSALGLLAIVLLNKLWDRDVEHPLTLRSLAVRISLVLGLFVCSALIYIGGIIIALMIAGVVLIVVVAVAVKHVLNRFAAIEADLRSTREIFGVPALEAERKRIEIRFNTGLDSTRSYIKKEVQKIESHLDDIDDLLDPLSSVTKLLMVDPFSSDMKLLTVDSLTWATGQTIRLKEAGAHIEQVKKQIKSLRIVSKGKLTRQRNLAEEALGAYGKQSVLSGWLSDIRAKLEGEASLIRKSTDYETGWLQEKLNNLAAMLAWKMSDLRADLGDMDERDRRLNAESARRIEKRQPLIEILSQELDDEDS